MTAPMPPEWAAVEAKAKQIEALEPERIEETAKGFRQAAGHLGDHTGKLNAAALGLREGAWTGRTADGFYGYVDELAGAGRQLESRLGVVADELSTLREQLSGIRTSAGERVEAARREIRRIDAEAAEAAAKAAARQDAIDRQVVGAVPPEKPPAVILAEAADRAVEVAKAADADVDRFLTEADTKIGHTRELLGRQTGGTFSAVRKPSTDTPGPAPRSAGASSGSGAADGGGGGTGSFPAVTSGGPPATMPPGNVQEWILEAIKELRAAGVPVSEADIANIWAIIEHESSGNPNAINLWDSNAAAGHPSKGLMQCIDPTFEAHKLPGHDDIYNPVDNIIAGVRYALDRYGSIGEVPGLQAMANGGAYRGY
ncbi:transglycosylase [Amycolatopsis sp. WAC 04197]|uniref:transglycosylase SLT domain-containing protein n=1 Tax=Amycolatopsis sp. WAC 04197 TaxID=2203199 RepID=UPI000F7A07B9|nr:transglycosylase SLT domain-containing protein [Amycolatopsis sp. WAC 04197]RSN39915.1 transglycosylase [Amycolatopsis sp. WAC 04197]